MNRRSLTTTRRSCWPSSTGVARRLEDDFTHAGALRRIEPALEDRRRQQVQAEGDRGSLVHRWQHDGPGCRGCGDQGAAGHAGSTVPATAYGVAELPVGV
jgi:hypothetical protein